MHQQSRQLCFFPYGQGAGQVWLPFILDSWESKESYSNLTTRPTYKPYITLNLHEITLQYYSNRTFIYIIHYITPHYTK